MFGIVLYAVLFLDGCPSGLRGKLVWPGGVWPPPQPGLPLCLRPLFPQGLLALLEACLLVAFGYAFGFKLVSVFFNLVQLYP